MENTKIANNKIEILIVTHPLTGCKILSNIDILNCNSQVNQILFLTIIKSFWDTDNFDELVISPI
jgi:hypothetical protein